MNLCARLFIQTVPFNSEKLEIIDVSNDREMVKYDNSQGIFKISIQKIMVIRKAARHT